MSNGSCTDATHLVGARTFAPANRAMLEALIVDLEAAAKQFSDGIADAETYYRALSRLQHPDWPEEARARFQAEVERLRPIVERRLTLPLNIQSCLSYSGIGMLKANESIGSKMALLAELLAMHRDASEALKEMPLGGPAVSPEESPVICSQAALARFEGRSEHTTGLAEMLTDEGILRAYTKPSRAGEKYKFWFADPARHSKALETISQKPSKRPARRRKA
jgi:hypothetical protein